MDGNPKRPWPGNGGGPSNPKRSRFDLKGGEPVSDDEEEMDTGGDPPSPPDWVYQAAHVDGPIRVELAPWVESSSDSEYEVVSPVRRSSIRHALLPFNHSFMPDDPAPNPIPPLGNQLNPSPFGNQQQQGYPPHQLGVPGPSHHGNQQQGYPPHQLGVPGPSHHGNQQLGFPPDQIGEQGPSHQGNGQPGSSGQIYPVTRPNGKEREGG